MKELILFSLRRRFMNGATLILNLLLCVLISCACFADKIIDWMNPTMLDNQKIYLNVNDSVEKGLISIEPKGIEFIHSEENPKDIIQKNPKAYVLMFDDGYKITSQYEIDSEILLVVETMINNVHKMNAMNEMLSLEELIVLDQNYWIENIILEETVQMDTNKQNIVFMLITSIYFAMLSFSTSVANEVVYEKSTRQLELILTSVQAKTHFLSKMIVGWVTIVVQSGSVLVYGFFFLLIRHLYDKGKGLIEFINKLGIVELKETTFLQFLKNVRVDFDFALKLFFIFFFLMMGILLLQMVMVVLSSFISSIEEAGNIQGPLYVILIVVYYLALSLNTPYQLSEGYGYILSFFPFLNMLFMPCRLMIQNVSIFELILSALISCLFMAIVLIKGIRVYQKGVLDYTNKGLLEILKKAFLSNE